MTVPAAYRWGACQALHRVAWDLGWSFDGRCARYNRVTALPLRFGKVAPAADWIEVLTQQLPPGARVVVNPARQFMAVTP